MTYMAPIPISTWAYLVFQFTFIDLLILINRRGTKRKVTCLKSHRNIAKTGKQSVESTTVKRTEKSDVI